MYKSLYIMLCESEQLLGDSNLYQVFGWSSSCATNTEFLSVNDKIVKKLYYAMLDVR